MRYAMTGATGFLGGVLARMLVDGGHDVVALVRQPEAASDLRDLGVTLVPGDLDDDAALDRLLDGAEGFFHVAGWFKFGRRERDLLHAVNVQGTRNALEAARRAGVRTVYTSTIALNSDTGGEMVDESYRFDGRHLTEYDKTKGQAHDVALEYAESGLPVVIVQPSVIYGPGDTSTLGEVSRRVADGRFALGPKGGGACWVHVDDVATGHVLAMEKGTPGESYILAGEAATYVEALSGLARMTGGRKPVFVPAGMVRVAARMNGLLERVVRLPPDQTREAMLASTARYYADSGKAQRELGWTPRTLMDGFADTVGTRA
jgi:nucleoside-diphosphate-sugar epimerase